MKKLVKMGVTLAAATSMTIATPAYAAKDGEAGYAIGCLIGWWVFGLTETCQEL